MCSHRAMFLEWQWQWQWQWQWHSGKSNICRWRPGLTGVSAGVMTQRKKKLLHLWGLLYWQGVYLHTVKDSVQHIEHEMYTKEHVTKHRQCWNKFTNSNRWNPRIQGNTTENSGRPGGDKRAREAKHEERKLAVTVAHQSLLSSNLHFNNFNLCEEPITLFLDFVHQPISKYWMWICCCCNNPSRNHWMRICCCWSIASFADACDAELRSCCVFRGRPLFFFFSLIVIRQIISLVGGILSYTPEEPHVAFCPIFVHPLFPVFELHIQKWVIFVRRRPCVCDIFRFESPRRTDYDNWTSRMSRTTRGKNNIVRVFLRRRRRPKAGDAFTRTRLMPTFGVSAALSVEHCRPQTGNVQRKAGWRSKGVVFGV